MASDRKVLSLDELIAVRAAARQAGKTVVHCHGCFDIVHPGHIHHLEHARSLGDMLIVSVSADSHVTKGVNRPLIPDTHRARNLAALAAVDHTYICPEPTAVELLERLRPDIYVKGREYETNHDPRFLREQETVARGGGRVVFSGGDVVYSSTAIIQSLGEVDLFEDEKLRRMLDRYNLTTQSLSQLISRFADLKIVIAGDFIIDRYHFCEALGIAGEAPVMSLRSIRQAEYDGGAAIVAAHLAGLGCTPTLVTSLAEDDRCRAAELRMSAAGIDVRGPRCRRNTVCKERYLVEETKMFRVEEGGPLVPESRTDTAIADELIHAAAGADAVIFTDFGYGTLSRGVLERAMPTLRRDTPLLVADVSGTGGSLAGFRGVDLICPTEREARHALGDFTGGLGAVVANLLGRLHVSKALITLGRKGLVSFDTPVPPDANGRLQSEYIPALSRRGIDPLGCGDALLATATATLAAGGPLVAAAFLGSHAAAFEVEQVGNIPLRAETLRKRVVESTLRQPERIAV
jgi:rfaE bifunctional protein kinase chain/domain/rfaE bifunctional protein nucleotidyltransferase chain/domain